MAPRASLRAVSPTRGTASLAPHFDVTAHIVLDDFGKAGRVYRETGEEDTTLGSVVDDLLTGRFQQSGARCRVQHIRRMVAGRVRGYSA